MSIEVSVREARQRLDHEAAFLVDVREPYEYAAAHVPHARLIPLGALPSARPSCPATATSCSSARPAAGA